MRTITLELSEAQFARLTRTVGRCSEGLSEFLKARLFDFLEHPTDPFDPVWPGRDQRDQEFPRRIA